MKSLLNEIRAYALRNSIEYDKADPSKILPKLFQHGLKKEEIKEIIPRIKQITNEVNTLPIEERESQFLNYKKYIPLKEEKEKTLPGLPNPSKSMTFRAAPYPSGAIHLGNAKTFLINSLYAEKYNADLLLIMDDTIGSKEKQIEKESYKLIEEAFSFLKIKYKKPIIYKSDRLEIYYKYALELIKKNKAYVCHCSQKKLHDLRKHGKDCEHRNREIKEQLSAWQTMFKSKPRSSTLRIKTSMQHPNPAFRDRVLFKISDREHPRVKKKYKVWPTLEMSWAVDDHLLNITHIIRGSDLLIEADMERYIWDIFYWKHPEIIHTGLVNIKETDAKISKSKAQKEVHSGKFSGWSDPRTWSIQSLERRGIKSESIREAVKDLGLNKQDITIPIEALYAINRRMIDKDSERFSFIHNPIELKIENAPKIKTVKIPIHPDKKETRKIKINKIYISKEDFQKLKGKEIRLLHLYNIKLSNKKHQAVFTSLENKPELKRINWVSEHVKTRILMPSGNWISGIAESAIKNLKQNQIIQFERFAFVKLDKKNKQGYEFWFAHK